MNEEYDHQNPANVHDHHLLPVQEHLAERFREAGLEPNLFTVTLYAFQHNGEDGLHRNGNEWNAEWDFFFAMADEGGCKPTGADIIDYMYDMMDRYDIGDHYIHEYRDGWQDPDSSPPPDFVDYQNTADHHPNPPDFQHQYPDYNDYNP